MPPSLRDWLAEDHLAFFISDAVTRWIGVRSNRDIGLKGRAIRSSFDPRMMVKVLIYGYATLSVLIEEDRGEVD